MSWEKQEPTANNEFSQKIIKTVANLSDIHSRYCRSTITPWLDDWAMIPTPPPPQKPTFFVPPFPADGLQTFIYWVYTQIEYQLQP